MSSLYERLGGEKAVDAAVAIFYRKVLAGGRIARFFDSIDMERQAAKQKAFLTMVFGGPANSSGKDMRQGHKHLVARGLNDSHVDAVVENLATTPHQLGVAERDMQEVNARANSVRNDVLNRWAARDEQSAKPKAVLYAEFLPLLNAKRVELSDHQRLVSQLCAFERRSGSAGRDKIDHPKYAHDDVVNAVAGLCVNVGGARKAFVVISEMLERAARPTAYSLARRY